MSATRVALVTGATGFVGGHLAGRLQSDGWETHAIVRPSSDATTLRDVLGSGNVHVHDGSTEGLVDILRNVHPEVVFHLASVFVAEHLTDDVDPLIRSNVLFGVQLLEAMTVAGVLDIVNTGSYSQHYEGREYSPVSLYAATKQAFQDILQFYSEVRGLRAVTLELPDTYGPDDKRSKLLSLLDQVARSGETLQMSPGEQLLDLLHVDDVVHGYEVAADGLLSGHLRSPSQYQLSSGSLVPLKDVVELYRQATGCTVSVVWGGRPYRLREVMEPVSPVPVLPEWQACISLRDGLAALNAESQEDTDGNR
ncbi:NAD-dependent epimerase/dehydratase family protein [Candidatus Cryosericum septentrionale]|uniref:NAD-dependent epimerase/dehydratase family protein n=1 Tax=Candidatus Cryosericum septentrionale TaxID=2290913 RepID=UPI001A9D0C19|nr:NAD(P)-dependent oxidoreductase [Candidatus Cryosericum septentrionale]